MSTRAQILTVFHVDTATRDLVQDHVGGADGKAALHAAQRERQKAIKDKSGQHLRQRSLESAERVSLWDGGAAMSCGVPAGLEAGDGTGVVPPLTARTRRGVRTGAFSQTT